MILIRRRPGSLVKIGRTAKDRVRLRRAGMALASMQGRSVPQIA